MENTRCFSKFRDNEGKSQSFPGKPRSNSYSVQIKNVFSKESFAAKLTLIKADDCRNDNVIKLIGCLSEATCAILGEKHYQQGRWRLNIDFAYSRFIPWITFIQWITVSTFLTTESIA